MARLINDSGVLGDTLVTAANVSEVPLDKMFEAIHIIQTEMDVTGTTAKEAASTISGSFSAFQASWKNLLSGLADEKDVQPLVDTLFSTGETLVHNIAALIPRIGENTLIAFDSFLSRWDIYNDIKGAFKEKGLAGVVSEVKTFVTEAFAEWGPIAYQAGTDLLAGIYSGLTGNATTGKEIRATLDGIWTQAQGAIDVFVDAGSSVISSIYTGITGDTGSEKSINEKLSTLWDVGNEKVSGFVNTASGVFSGILKGLNEGDITAIDVSDAVAGAFSGGFTAIDSLKTATKGLLAEVYTGITGKEATAENVGETIGGVLSATGTATVGLLTTFENFSRDLSEAILSDPQSFDEAGNAIAGVFNAGVEASKNLLIIAKNFGFDLYGALKGKEAQAEAEAEFDDNMDRFSALGERVKEVASNIGDSVSGFFGEYVAPGFEGAAERAEKNPLYDFFSDFFVTVDQKLRNYVDSLGIEQYQADLNAQWYMMKYSPEEIEAAMQAVKSSPGNGEEVTMTWTPDYVQEASSLFQIGALTGDNLSMNEVADAIVSAYREAQEAESPTAPEETESETSGSFLSDIVSAVNQAVEAGTAAASIPITLTVHTAIDGQEIANIITTKAMAQISRQIMQRRYTGG